jgi:hypothetical protein
MCHYDQIGVLFEGYASKWYGWQILILARRSLLVFLIVMFNQGRSQDPSCFIFYLSCPDAYHVIAEIDHPKRLGWLTFVNIIICLSHVLARYAGYASHVDRSFSRLVPSLFVFCMPNSPYRLSRVNRTESISLCLLALLSSILGTLEPQLSTDAAIGLAFLTIVPAIGFGIIVIISYLSHINRAIECCRHFASTNGNDDDDDLHDLDTSIAPIARSIASSHGHGINGDSATLKSSSFSLHSGNPNAINQPLLS